MRGQIIACNGQCPKCGSYMFMPRRIKGHRCYKCKMCGKVKYDESLFTRLKYQWKSWKERKVVAK